MSDMNFDGYLNVSEILGALNPATDQNSNAQMSTYWTNLFNEYDYDGNGLLDDYEFKDLMERNAEIAADDCYPVSVGDVILGNGTFTSANGSNSSFMETGETVTLNGTFCQWMDMSSDGILYTIDTNGDGNASLSEIVAWMGVNASDANHLQMIGWMFDTYDKNSDAMLNPNEFGDFVMWMNSDQEYMPTTEQIMTMWDLNQDGSITLTEIIEHLNTMNMEEGEANLSDIEIEYFGILFKMSDLNSN
jgi:Ca2+-binding EF-hand superfamily protein